MASQANPSSKSPLQHRRRIAAISRKLRPLRAHGLIQKLPKTHRYQLKETGRLAINAIIHDAPNQLVPVEPSRSTKKSSRAAIKVTDSNTTEFSRQAPAL